MCPGREHIARGRGTCICVRRGQESIVEKLLKGLFFLNLIVSKVVLIEVLAITGFCP